MDGHDPETDRGNRTVYCILQLAVVLLLLVALINFANFSMSQAPVRLRSINTRKVMGESNFRLRLQLMGEGVVVCLCALVLSLLWAACIGRWEYIGEYTFGSIAVSDHPDIALLLTAVSIVVGICATVYSTHYATSFQPAMVLKGNYGQNPGGRRLRRLLVGLQLVVAFVMVIFVGIVYCQRSYIYHSDYGYDKDNVLTADLTALPQEQYAALRSELEKVNGVESASFSFEILGANDTHMKWARHNDGAPYQFVAWPVDWKFLRTMGIGIIEGRDFKETDGDVCIINEAFKRKCPDIIELGKPLDGGELPILGVGRNFRASTVRTDCNTEPLAFIIFGERNAGWGNQTRILYVRTAPHADRKTMRTEVSRTLETFYDGQATTPEVKCYDDILEQTYKDEMRFYGADGGQYPPCIPHHHHRRLLPHTVRDGVPPQGDCHTQGDGQQCERGVVALRHALCRAAHHRIPYSSPHWLRHQSAVAAAICSTRPHSLVDIPPGFRHRRHSRSPHRHRTMLAGGNDESRGKHPDGIVHSPLTDGPPHTFP